MDAKQPWARALPRDLAAGTVVFLVALPLCLGVALASNAPLFSGVLAGIVGGILVGAVSGSQTSVAGPAAGLTAIVAAQIALLGSFPAFLTAVVVAGALQITLGLLRTGFIAAFFPSSVIKGLLAAIGVILILKQIPHVFGHDSDPEGEMAFSQPDHENTFSELARSLFDIHPGATLIGLLSIFVLVCWDKIKTLKKSIVPAPLVVVLMGVGLNLMLASLGGRWLIEAKHLVQVPVAAHWSGILGFLQFPDLSQLSNPRIYMAGVTIALVASLETLLNLEAVDKIDPRQRTSPPNRELFAQGIGNLTVGLLGGIPVTSVIVRSSVNVNAGGQTKASTIFHGLLLLVAVMFLPTWLNMIPLSCLAAILLVTGIKLASPKLVRQMWREGKNQFIPFAATVVAIVLTDLLIGILIGLVISVSFILSSNLRRPIRRFIETHIGGEVLHIELANQVSFLNRAALMKTLDEVRPGQHVLLDAQSTDYVDPDILDLIRDFKEQTAPARGVDVSVIGFREKYQLRDEIQFVDYSTRELQNRMTPDQVLGLLKDGHQRFRMGRRLNRDLGHQMRAAQSQHPLAVVLSCIDSRAPAEIVFDLGLGDIFSVRVAGNITSRKVLGSVEYGCAVAGAKLVLVMGHSHCGAVTTAVKLKAEAPANAAEATGCQHVEHVVSDIQACVGPAELRRLEGADADTSRQVIDEVARANVKQTVSHILQQSETIAGLVREGRIKLIGAFYDVVSGELEFLPSPPPTNS